MNQPPQAGKRIVSKAQYVNHMEACFRRMSLWYWLATGVVGGITAGWLVYTIRGFSQTHPLWTCLRIALGIVLCFLTWVLSYSGKSIRKAAKNGSTERLWVTAHLRASQPPVSTTPKSAWSRLSEACKVGWKAGRMGKNKEP